jgi:NTE family protein
MRRAFVLAGGGCLGAMQAGALRAMLERGIRPTEIVGCSVGAINGAFLAVEPSLAQVEKLAHVWRTVTRGRVYPGGRPTMLWRVLTGKDSLYDNRGYYAYLQEIGWQPALTFGDLAGADFYVTATSLRTGGLHVFGERSSDCVLDALMASGALPPMLSPWSIDGERFVDGGVTTPLPVRVALDHGCTEIFAFDLGCPPPDSNKGEMRGLAAHLAETASIMLHSQVQHDAELAEHTRGVKLYYVALRAPYPLEPIDFSHGAELMDVGYRHTVDYLARMKSGTLEKANPAVQAWLQALVNLWPPAVRFMANMQ